MAWLSLLSQQHSSSPGHFEQYTDITPLFYAGIVVSAWFGGMGPGLLAVALATAAIDYYFTPPLYALGLGTKHITALVVFGFLAVVT